jgi:glycosyltransferase involved in cell wall biosynthesis
MNSDRPSTAVATTTHPPRVLVVAYHFPPEGSVGTHRTLRLVRHLAASGWDITVLTGTTSTYSSGCVIDRDLLERVPGNVRVVRAPALRPVDRVTGLFGRKARSSHGAKAQPNTSTSRPSAGGRRTRIAHYKKRLDAVLGIPDQHVGWLWPAIAAGMTASIGRAPDVIYSTAPPWTGQLVARALSSLLRCSWVADFRDPWARAPWREARLPLATRAAELMERAVVRRADAIVFTTRTNMEENAAFYGAAAAKFHLVRNGCDRAEFDGLAPVVRDDRFTILHAGSMYGGRRPSVLFSALASLRDRGVIDARSFCFRQIGRVALGGVDVAAESARLGLQGLVEVLETMPRRDILREMAGASCLLLLQPGTTVSIPGKLFEYFAAGRPILAIAEAGETADLVRASGCGLAVLPDDQAGMEAAIERLVRGSSFTPPPIELFDGQLRTREIVSILERVSRRHASPLPTSPEPMPEQPCPTSASSGAQR